MFKTLFKRNYSKEKTTKKLILKKNKLMTNVLYFSPEIESDYIELNFDKEIKNLAKAYEDTNYTYEDIYCAFVENFLRILELNIKMIYGNYTLFVLENISNNKGILYVTRYNDWYVLDKFKNCREIYIDEEDCIDKFKGKEFYENPHLIESISNKMLYNVYNNNSKELKKYINSYKNNKYLIDLELMVFYIENRFKYELDHLEVKKFAIRLRNNLKRDPYIEKVAFYPYPDSLNIRLTEIIKEDENE